MKKIFWLLFGFILITFLPYWYLVGPVGFSKETITVIVPQNQESYEVVKELHEKKLIRNRSAFSFLFNISNPLNKIKSGGYYLNQNMSAQTIIQKINGEPDMAWITMTSCLRKEQIGEILAHYLNWNEEKLNKWNTVDTNSKPEYYEGVYYPDTYLIPRDESGEQVAQRLINRFNEKFNPLADAFIAGNIRWTTALKIASLIAREAAGKEDMRLISGIIWNRLNIGMPLQIDATMQYTLGKNQEGKWWGSIDINEKQNDSPYNSYLYKGLPPTPICSPNIDYIEAVLYPEETPCLFYLHDGNGQIHCSETYEEHLENIDRYLN